ncbi:MAG TPA: hypothetical protein VKG25_14415 [Bryobacteraceae bacterium]|nr:hypothetical protein [Bryobacteraceae bacterium]
MLVFSVLPLLSKEFHLIDLQLGMLGSSFALVYCFADPCWVAWLTGSAGRPRS